MPRLDRRIKLFFADPAVVIVGRIKGIEPDRVAQIVIVSGDFFAIDRIEHKILVELVKLAHAVKGYSLAFIGGGVVT